MKIRQLLFYFVILLILSSFSGQTVIAKSANIRSLSRTSSPIARMGCSGNPVEVIIGRQRVKGVYLHGFSSRSYASRCGLKQGDVMYRINGKAVETPRGASVCVSSANQRQLVIEYATARSGRYVPSKKTVFKPLDQRAARNVSIRRKKYHYLKKHGYKIPDRKLKKIPNASLESLAFRELNAVRQKHGLNKLSYSSSLASVARDYAEDMCRRRFFSHTNPEGLGIPQRMKKAGILRNGVQIRENLCSPSLEGGGSLSLSVSEALKSFMHSHRHKGNVIDPRNNYVGVGIVVGDDNQMLMCQLYSNEDP